MERKHWTLLVIEAGSRPLTPAQLQKSVFLTQRKFPDEPGLNEYNFEPYNYGPFDSQVYTDAELLAAEGLVAPVAGGGGRWTDYIVTPKGIEFLKSIARHSYIKAVVEWSQRLSFNELIAAIYKAFPATRVNSVFREQTI